MQLLKPTGADNTAVDEDALVERASRGDADAFADLYERYLARMYRYFYYRTGHREDAEDMSEQVFLKAWQALPRYNCRGAPFSAWLFRLAHNLLIDRARTHRRGEPLEEALDIEDGDAGPEELAVRRAEARELAGAVSRLSAVEQTVVTLRFIEGLDHRTVSGIIGKSEVATRSIQSRALARLARMLASPERNEP